MSPIFVRPVREQLEHDRLIRYLQARLKRKHDVAVNLGDEQVAPVKIGTNLFYPDLVLTGDKKLAGIIEIETGESVNRIEAMAQWVHFAKLRVPFSLYVPVSGFDTARRLCEALGVRPTEVWTYRGSIDSFDLVRMVHDAGAVRAAARSRPAAGKSAKASKKAPARKAAQKTVKKAAKKTVRKTTKKAAKKAAKKKSAPRKAAVKTGARKK